MNKFKYYFILSITTISLFSCSKNNGTAEITPARDYAVQYATDINTIEEYLKTNYITVSADQDVVITKIPAGGTQESIWDQTTYELKSKDVNLHDIVYKLYYLVLREGTQDRPTNVDGVLTAYKGEYLEQETTAAVTTLNAKGFEEVKYPQQILSLFSTITGWGEIFPEFKTGNFSSNADGTVSYSDFGAGVMFIPSGLAYFNKGAGTIPSYAPLVFSFKLYAISRSDMEVKFVNGVAISDPDGIPSYLEDINGDGYIYDYRNTVKYPTPPADAIRYADDTDKDGIPDFLDSDDDGDNYTTKLEIKNLATGLPFPFGSIPTCSSGKKIYLDPTCHP
jgi:hypothetical protein